MSAQGTTLSSQQDAGAMVDAYVDALLAMPLVPPPATAEQAGPGQEARAEPGQALAMVAETGALPEPEALADADCRESDAAADRGGLEAEALPDVAADPAIDAVATPEPEAWPDDEVALEAAPRSFDDAQTAAAPAIPAPTPPQAMPAPRAALPEPVFPPLAELDDDRRIHTAPAGQRWLRVAVGDDRYAVELLRVQEVVRLAPVIAVRGAVPSLLGVMNLRGRVVPVHDLGRWLRRQPVQPDDRARIVVLEYQDELVGMLVTAVTDVVTLDTPQIEPPTPGLRDRVGMGIARTPGAPPTVLLDARVVFD